MKQPNTLSNSIQCKNCGARFGDKTIYHCGYCGGDKIDCFCHEYGFEIVYETFQLIGECHRRTRKTMGDPTEKAIKLHG